VIDIVHREKISESVEDSERDVPMPVDTAGVAFERARAGLTNT
jgi:hypothetical protein